MPNFKWVSDKRYWWLIWPWWALKSEFSLQEQIEKNRIEWLKNRPSTYWERVSDSFSDTWKSIKEDIDTTSADISWNQFNNLFTKTVPTAIWTSTRWIISPITAWISWLFTWWNNEKTILSETLKWVWTVFSWVEKWLTKVWEWLWLEWRYAELFWEWATNIATWEIGWALISKWLSKAKVTREAEKYIMEFDDAIKSSERDIATFNADNYFAKQNAVQKARQLWEELKEWIISGTLNKKEVLDRTKELESLWATNTRYFVERLEEWVNASLLKEVNERVSKKKTENQIKITKAKKELDNPTLIKDANLRAVASDAKTLRDNWFFNLNSLSGKAIFSGWIPSVSKATKKLFKDRLTVDADIQKAIEHYKSTLTQNEVDLSTLAIDNQIKKELGELWLDSADNPFKRSALVRLEDEWIIIKEVNPNNPNLYSYKLTDEWVEYSKSLWMSEKQLENAKTIGFVEHNIKDIEAFRWKQLEPSILDRSYQDLKNALEERASGKSTVSDSKIKRSLFDINSKYNLWLRDAIQKANTPERLQVIIDKVLNKAEDYFTQPNSIKWKTKIILASSTKKMFDDIRETNIKIGQDKAKWVDKYKLSLEKIKSTYKERIDKLAKKYKDQKEIMQAAIRAEIDKKNRAIMQLNVKYGKIAELKSDRIKELKRLSANGKILWNINKAIAKVSQFKNWNNIKTVKQLEEAFTKLDQEVMVQHIIWLKGAIEKELSKLHKTWLSDAKKYRLSRTPEVDAVLMEISSLYRANKSVLEDVEWLNTILRTIRELNSQSKKIAKKAEIERSNDTISNIKTIKDEWIKSFEWSRDLDNKVWLVEFLKAKYKDWTTASQFIYHTMDEVFNWWLGKKIFADEPRMSINEMDNFKEKFIIPEWEYLVKTLWDETEDWWAWMMLRQMDNSWDAIWLSNYIWYDRIKYSPKLSRKYLAPRETPSGKKPDWIIDEVWDEIKDKKLWEIAERMEVDPKFLEARVRWKTLSDNMFEMYSTVVKEFDWIDLKKRDDYFMMLTEEFVRKAEFEDSDNLFRPTVSNKNANDTVKTIKWNKQELEFSVDPIRVLYQWYNDVLKQIFLRKQFEKMSDVYYGRKYQYSRLDEWEREALLLQRDKDGNTLYDITDRYWNIISNDGWNIDLPEWMSMDDIFITNLEWWIRKQMNKSTREFFDDYLRKFARWWNANLTWLDRLVSKIWTQVSANTLWFSPSSIAQQPLSLIDAAMILPIKSLLQWMRELTFNPELFRRMENTSHAVKARKWDNTVYQEVMSHVYDNDVAALAKKWLREYNKYALWLMRAVDGKVFWTIFYTAYRDYLKKAGKEFVWQFNDVEAIKYAEDIAERAAGTSNRLLMPPMYNNAFAKIFFQLMTTQLNRYKTFRRELRSAIDWQDYGRAFKVWTVFTTANAAQIMTVYAVSKALFWAWLTTYDPDKDWNLLSKLVWLDWLFQLTVGQSPIPAKIYWTVKFDSISPIEWAIKDIWTGIWKMSEWEIEWLKDLVSSFIWEKPIKYISNLFSE